MVLKRPSTLPEQPQRRAPEPDVELVEQLVKKSLDINPDLRDGKNTHQVMQDLKRQAVARSKEGGAGGGIAAPRGNLAERRRGTIAFFFEQKASDFETAVADVTARERLLQQEKQALRDQVVGDLADFFALMAGGIQSPEAKDVIRENRPFLSKLGITEADLVAAASRRK
ncbi:MAG: hypothetical protein HY903_02405 [Deltaproteobacteria bacterium]|nr:hypothetical protein [Deltaproteobacteria bacterium]